MATWNAALPDSASVGDAGHVEDHNAIVDAITEIRSVIDGLETQLGSLAIGDVAGLSGEISGIKSRLDELETPPEG